MKTQTDIMDIQATIDQRNVALDQVGICKVKFPLSVTGIESEASAQQQVQAELSLSVDLEPEHKGIHMSRLVESVQSVPSPFSLASLGHLLTDLRDRQGAHRAKAVVTFTYFLNREAPVSGLSAPQGYECKFSGKLGRKKMKLKQSVQIPVTTLCPCSKAISEYGAHNQRGYVDITLHHRSHDTSLPSIQICLEEMITLAEESGSAPLYPLLKRTDERHVTMQAFDNPTFVEDAIRNVAVRLREDERFDRFTVRVENHESIHQHNAFAQIRKR